jgi:membrane protease YdiL (CAAX protease family)
MRSGSALDARPDATVGRPHRAGVPMKTSALVYFAFVFGWSLAFWAASVVWRPPGDLAESLMFLLGGAGPVVAAVLLTQTREPATVRRDFWLRIVDVRRLRGVWLAVALLLHPALVGLAFAIDAAMGGSLPTPAPAARSANGLLGLAFFVFWFGPLPEEMGWRGFALDRLRVRMPALSASLLLGSIWALWHVPLFFVPGSFQQGLGVGSMRSWIFLASMVPLSVLITCVYANTVRSTLSAVLIHYSGNLCGALFAKSDRVAGIELVLLCAAAAAVVVVWGAEDLAGRRAEPAADG